MSNEFLNVVISPLPQSAFVSINGRFQTSDVIEFEDLHIHSLCFRDVASYIGVTLLLIMSLVSMGKGRGMNRSALEE